MNRTQTAVWSVTHANNRNWLIAATKSDINLRRRRWMICRSRDIDRTTPDRGILQVIGSHDSRQRTSGSRVHSTKDRQFARLGVSLTASEIKVYSVQSVAITFMLPLNYRRLDTEQRYTRIVMNLQVLPVVQQRR